MIGTKKTHYSKVMIVINKKKIKVYNYKAFNFNLLKAVIVITVTSEDVCCNIRNVKLTVSFLDYADALSIFFNVCNRCLFSFPSEIGVAEE